MRLPEIPTSRQQYVKQFKVMLSTIGANEGSRPLHLLPQFRISLPALACSTPTELRAHTKPDALYSSLLLGTPAATKHCCLQTTAFRYRFSTGAALQRNPRPGLKNHWGTMFTFIFRCHTDAVVSIVVSGRATPRLHRLPCRCRYEFCSASLFSR